jgi:hypothetical protein
MRDAFRSEINLKRSTSVKRRTIHRAQRQRANAIRMLNTPKRVQDEMHDDYERRRRDASGSRAISTWCMLA